MKLFSIVVWALAMSSRASSKLFNIGYIPGWERPAPPLVLQQAGYTHAVVAFGVFSISKPGTIVSAFNPPAGILNKTYFSELQNHGLKVLLSLGGASSNLADTTVDFHRVLSASSSPDSFVRAFVASVQNMVRMFGFDGIDIDIEKGLGPAHGGNMSHPSGDIKVLADIIRKLHADDPEFLLTLAPQTANVSPSRTFDAIWGNYASLLSQSGVAPALTWVGIQLYNTGCTNGLNKICYPNIGTTPDYGVAMASNLLEDWPSGYQSYKKSLKVSQIVLGYPAPNARNLSDGSPATHPVVIRRTVTCLKNLTGCGTYRPPRAYGLIAGVFNWHVGNDASSGYKFACNVKCSGL